MTQFCAYSFLFKNYIPNCQLLRQLDGFTSKPCPKKKDPPSQISNRVVKVGLREVVTGEEWKEVEEGTAGRGNRALL